MIHETHHCRHCAVPLDLVFADLGSTPVSNAFLTAAQVNGPEPFYPLKALVCRNCWLVQLQDFFTGPDLFAEDYIYFSSYSKSWLNHSACYAKTMIERFALNDESLAIEVASNDGYLLQYLKEGGVPVLGIEPSLSVAGAASARGIPTLVEFFGKALATRLVKEGRRADLMTANNVLAHVPDINDFVAGFAILLKPAGVATFEFPHLLNLMRQCQFDTIYHEHFSYLSLLAVERIFSQAGLRIFDVEQLSTHGGSLRVYACHADAGYVRGHGVDEIRRLEAAAGLDGPTPYLAFGEQVRETKRALLELLIALKRQGSRIAGYGAAAKGNTLLNYCGVGSDMIEFVVDRSPHKQGLFLPGTRLPVLSPQRIEEQRPDYVLILPWNLRDEIIESLGYIRGWGGQFIVPIPRPTVIG